MLSKVRLFVQVSMLSGNEGAHGESSESWSIHLEIQVKYFPWIPSTIIAKLEWTSKKSRKILTSDICKEY